MARTNQSKRRTQDKPANNPAAKKPRANDSNTRQSRKDAIWSDPDKLLQNQNSPLYDLSEAALQKIIHHPKTQEILSTKPELLALKDLPDRELRDAVREFKKVGKQGFYDAAWIEQAIVAWEKRKGDHYEKFEREKFVNDWGIEEEAVEEEIELVESPARSLPKRKREDEEEEEEEEEEEQSERRGSGSKRSCVGDRRSRSLEVTSTDGGKSDDDIQPISWLNETEKRGNSDENSNKDGTENTNGENRITHLSGVKRDSLEKTVKSPNRKDSQLENSKSPIKNPTNQDTNATKPDPKVEARSPGTQNKDYEIPNTPDDSSTSSEESNKPQIETTTKIATDTELHMVDAEAQDADIMKVKADTDMDNNQDMKEETTKEKSLPSERSSIQASREPSAFVEESGDSEAWSGFVTDG